MTSTRLQMPPELTERDDAFIGGRWVRAGGEKITVFNPTTGESAGSVTAASEEVVDAAVEAAAAAFESWRALTPRERGEYLVALGEALDKRAEVTTDLITLELGMARQMTQDVQVLHPAHIFAREIEYVGRVTWEEKMGNSTVYYDPVGVVAAITPWNGPIMQIAVKIAPALIAGCTVVCKPSELAPLGTYILAEAAQAARFPAGVLNVVQGLGPSVGEQLVSHPKVDMVSFTGSVRGGARVGELAARDIKRAVMELGGKSPAVILDDATLEVLDRAVQHTAFTCTLINGQVCEALTRLIVPRAKLAVVERMAAEAFEGAQVGDPFDESTVVGPMISNAQRDKVVAYIRRGIEEGARVVTGGPEPPEGLDRGYFVRPTVFSDVRPGMRIAQEEIFGPVLSIIPYDGGDDEAVQIANGTPYGLAAAVFGADTERAWEVGRRIDCGTINVNGAEYDLEAPFGGHKKSGIGREHGVAAIREYLQSRAVQAA